MQVILLTVVMVRLHSFTIVREESGKRLAAITYSYLPSTLSDNRIAQTMLRRSGSVTSSEKGVVLVRVQVRPPNWADSTTVVHDIQRATSLANIVCERHASVSAVAV